jgi:hypothetical protein
MAISRRPVSFFSSFDPQAPGLESLIENADASSIGILSDQRESKDLSYRPLRHQRSQLLIANFQRFFSPASSRLIVRTRLARAGSVPAKGHSSLPFAGRHVAGL